MPDIEALSSALQPLYISILQASFGTSSNLALFIVGYAGHYSFIFTTQYSQGFAYHLEYVRTNVAAHDRYLQIDGPFS